MPTSIRLLRLVALLLVAVTAAADGKPKSAVERSAEAHFRRGAEARKAGRYIEAVAEYSAAYGLVPAPELLFNIAQAHRLAGAAEEAIAYYRKYLTKSPNGAGAAEAKQWLAYLAPGAPSAPATAPERPPAGPEGRRPVATRPASTATPATPSSPTVVPKAATATVRPSPLAPSPPAPAAATQPTPPAKSRAWIWGVGGGAAAVVVGAVVIGVVAGTPRDPSPSLGRVAVEGL